MLPPSLLLLIAILPLASTFSSFVIKPFVPVPQTLVRSSSINMYQLERSQTLADIGRDRKVVNGDRRKVGTLSLPAVGVGTIQWIPESEEEEQVLRELVQAATARGVDFFDTAERYGASPFSLIPAALSSLGEGLGITPKSDKQQYLGGDCESRLGSWVGASRNQPGGSSHGAIATKFTPVPWRRDAASVVEACRASAERMGVRSVDLYQIHMPDIVQPFKVFGVEDNKDEAYWDGLAECYHLGLAKNVGVSNYGPTLVSRAHAHLAKRGVPLASNQIHYSLLYRKQGAQATVDRCKELGVQVLAYYPMAMGLLTDKLSPNKMMATSKGRDMVKYLVGGKGVPSGGVEPLLEVMREVAQTREKTVAQVALNWIICQGAIPIGGATKLQHVEDNVGAMGWRLTEGEMAKMEEAADALGFEYGGTTFKTADSKFVGYGYEKWTLD